MEEKVYFEFLQVAVGNRKSLSVGISDADWLPLFELCKRQALIGVGFSAVEKLHALGVVCPSALRMKWMTLALQIERRNVLLNEQCRRLTEQYGHDGLSTCILKGQGNCLNYPEGLNNRRQCGDIDLWAVPLPPSGGYSNGADKGVGITIAVQTGKNEVEYVEYHGRKAVIEYVRMQHRLAGNNEKPFIRYHHIEAPKMEGTEVEVHFRVGFLNSPLRNWRMQRWFDEHADVCMKNKTQMGFAAPTSSVNVVYQMCHLFSHYFDEGLGLRQLMDYYFALRVWHNDVMECKDLQTQGMWSEGLGTPVMSKVEVMSVLRSFGMAKFAAAVMWVLNEVFGGVNENDNENENEKCPQMNTDGCPQADFEGEQQLSATGQQLKEIGPQADGGGEHEFSRISRELKGIGPQADFEGEQLLINDERFMINDCVHAENTERHGCPQADERWSEISRKGQKWNRNKRVMPWMICEPNEKEGRRLLAEIMQGGNFGQYDTRDAALKRGGMVKHGVWKLKRVMRLVSSYPEEALWEPVFRVWHLVWRGING